jgi:hypothetical protein
MGKRVEWLKLQLRHGRPMNLPRALATDLAFEAYYQLCAALGHRPRHFLDPLPESLREMRAGKRVLMIWPRLPLSIRMLDRVIFPGWHAELVPYTREAFEAAKASGRRVEFMEVVSGELRREGGCR